MPSSRLLIAARQQPRYRQIFIRLIPMQAAPAAANSYLRPLLRPRR